MALASLLVTVLCVFVAQLQVSASYTFDVSVGSVSYALSDDRKQMSITADFTASQEPPISFTIMGWTKPLDGTVVNFSNGHGTVSVSLEWKYKYLSFYMTVGEEDIHLLRVYMELNDTLITGDKMSMTQELNTVWSNISTDYDVAYSPGSTFTVNALVPWVAAKHFVFTWEKWNDTTNERDAQTSARYLDPATNKVIYSREYPIMGDFLTVSKKRHYARSSELNYTFTTAQAPVYGVFRLYSWSRHAMKHLDHFIPDLEENIYLTVHEDSTPGPYPAGFSQVDVRGFPKQCTSEKTSCRLQCEGYGNDIQSFKIIKRDNRGTKTEIGSRPFRSGKYYAKIFSESIDNEAEGAVSISCELTASDGGRSSGTRVFFG